MAINTFSMINYLDADFDTLKERLKLILRSSDVYKDYDFEGSNISTLIEMCSYLGDLNSFYVNKLANNIMPETTDIYEVAHSHARRMGYEPKGYISSKVVLNVRISQSIVSWNVLPKFKAGDNIVIPKGYHINSGITSSEGVAIYYTVSDDISFDVTIESIGTITVNNEATTYYIDIPVSVYQGSLTSTTFTSDDIIDSRLYLENIQYDHSDTNPICSLTINGEKWLRVLNPFDSLDIVVDDVDSKKYMIRYDKYGRYYIWFFGNNSPLYTDSIVFDCNDTIGTMGSIGANATWEKTVTQDAYGQIVSFLYNTTTFLTYSVDDFTIENINSSYGAKDVENIIELNTNSQNMIYTQNRNVTYKDFRKNIENFEMITNACVYGEYEAKTGTDEINVYDFNRVYSSFITKDFDITSNPFAESIFYSPTIDQLPLFCENVSPTITTSYPFIYRYTNDLDDILRDYNINKSLIGISMITKVPNIVMFSFDIGLRVKKQYSYKNVENDLKNKLVYYFNRDFRNFGDDIDFRDISNFISDIDVTSETDKFSNVSGISSFTIRDIHVFYPFSQKAVFVSGVEKSTTFDLGGHRYSFKIGSNGDNVDSMSNVNVGDIITIGDDVTNKYLSYGTVYSIVTEYIDIENEIVDYYTVVIQMPENLSVYEIERIDLGQFWLEKMMFDEVYTQEGLSKYEQNYKNFPYYIVDADYMNNTSNFSNTSMTIQLGFDQFPMLALEHCIIYNEGIK